MMATQASSVLIKLMSASVTVANQAGKIIREIMKKGNLGIVDKGINDIQTEADRSAQRCIVNSLSKHFPKVTIIGEETLEKIENEDGLLINLNNCESIAASCPDDLQSVKEEDVVIWVDPLDGTAEYTQGLLDHVTVLIGLAVKGKAVGGVIHQPYYNYKNEKDWSKLGRTMWGIVGVGGGGILYKAPPEDKRIITTTRSHSNPVINSTIEALKPDEVLRVGGAGHKVLHLIEGKAHAYVSASKRNKKWDTCAPDAVLHAFGGKMTDISGKQIQYHADVDLVNPGVVATHLASVHSWYTQSIPKEIKDHFQTKA
ncbi:3'(2'),5'-bisphosphate nucleotidase 1 isoform X2 [Parasteatoda tepidariorum]|uniref:3'(2'),5'-bisphosphate nucleotidase 1 isoform X2 n=1 Tax=Parasteatoda tepidariorum TaxID=114398 RepID=UPI00077FBA6B|nr:3'(2'),5'-bisphosphate nucleotidase 1 isoform X2 [Parasteatoda tepidariorum]